MSEPNPPTGAPGPSPATDPTVVDVRVPPTGAATPGGFSNATPRTGADTSVAEPDWTDQVTDLVVDTVDKVRDRTTGPVLKASRIAVYGLVALIIAIPLITVGIILIGRLLELFPGPIWIPYSILGIILVLVGLFVWGKRRPSSV